mgnify:CR=1 FL=1
MPVHKEVLIRARLTCEIMARTGIGEVMIERLVRRFYRWCKRMLSWARSSPKELPIGTPISASFAILVISCVEVWPLSWSADAGLPRLFNRQPTFRSLAFPDGE